MTGRHAPDIEHAFRSELRTERLLLRPFVEEDVVAFVAMNADPRVMEHIERPLSRDE